MSAERLRIVIVDDQPVMRSGLAMIISAHDDLEVVGEAGDGRAGIDLVLATEPEVVLMDIQMPELDGIAATQQLVAQGTATRVLILTTFGQERYVFDAFEAGAAGFLLKTAEPRLIVDAIRTVAAGNSLLAPQLTHQIITSYLAGRRAVAVPAAYGRLTDREQEVLRCLAGGLSNAEIGHALFIGEGTVKTHVARILDKLGLRDRVQAVVFAHRHGLAS
ncbi:MAG TPA: response regulator transcription factor [Nocardioides sp.]|nr:response regulator transcription factor [Nocardioides sp.]